MDVMLEDEIRELEKIARQKALISSITVDSQRQPKKGEIRKEEKTQT